MRSLIRPLKHVRLLGSIEPAAGFEHADFRACLCQYVRGHSAAGARTHNHYVVRFFSVHDLSADFVYDTPRNVGQAEVASLKFVSKVGVFKAEQLQNGGV